MLAAALLSDARMLLTVLNFADSISSTVSSDNPEKSESGDCSGTDPTCT